MGQQPSLSWGVKQSFRNYVAATGGVTEASGAAEILADGAFCFAAGPGHNLRRSEGGALDGTASYRGDVRFEAHGGMLRVRLADPALEIAEGRGVLTIADGGPDGPRLAIANLDLTGMSEVDGELVFPTALTPDGSRVLGDHYAPGTALDPVRVRL